MTSILAARASEKRAAGEALIGEADDLACQSWNEKMSAVLQEPSLASNEPQLRAGRHDRAGLPSSNWGGPVVAKY